MKAFSRKSLQKRCEAGVKQYLDEHYEEMAYQVVAENAHYIAEQVEAMLLLTLAKQQGFGKKRLQEIHGEFCGLIRMPQAFGKQPKAKDCIKYLTEKYGIDFSEVKPNFMSYEEYVRDSKEA